MRLIQFAEIRNGAAFKAAKQGVGYVQCRHITTDGLAIDDLPIGEAPKRKLEELQLKAGDVLIDSRGETNFAAVVPEHSTPLFTVLDVIIVRLTDANILPEYLALYFNLPTTQQKLIGLRTTAVIARLDLKSLRELEFPIPSLGQQKLMADFAKEHEHQRKLEIKLSEARQRFTNEILRRSAEGELTQNKILREHLTVSPTFRREGLASSNVKDEVTS